MRIGVHFLSGVWQSNALEGLLGENPGFAAAHSTMYAQRLSHLLADLHHRVERGHRLLENHG